MLQTLIRNWWLLALCGGFEGICSFVNLVMREPDGSLSLRKYALKSTVVFMGKLLLAAGACTIFAGLWRSAKGKSWALALNGVALVALGLTFNGVFGFRISFRTIVLLLAAMALSTGIFGLQAARELRQMRHLADKWLFEVAGAISVGFASTFLVMASGWIKLQPGAYWDLIWFGAYFGFCAVCMVTLALRLHRLGRSQFGRQDITATLVDPRRAY